MTLRELLLVRYPDGKRLLLLRGGRSWHKAHRWPTDASCSPNPAAAIFSGSSAECVECGLVEFSGAEFSRIRLPCCRQVCPAGKGNGADEDVGKVRIFFSPNALTLGERSWGRKMLGSWTVHRFLHERPPGDRPENSCRPSSCVPRWDGNGRKIFHHILATHILALVLP